jgi:hypothetical protein
VEAGRITKECDHPMRMVTLSDQREFERSLFAIRMAGRVAKKEGSFTRQEPKAPGSG